MCIELRDWLTMRLTSLLRGAFRYQSAPAPPGLRIRPGAKLRDATLEYVRGDRDGSRDEAHEREALKDDDRSGTYVVVTPGAAAAEPKGVTVVVMTGLGSCAAEWFKASRAIATRPGVARVVVYDRRGYGRSDPDVWAADVPQFSSEEEARLHAQRAASSGRLEATAMQLRRLLHSLDVVKLDASDGSGDGDGGSHGDDTKRRVVVVGHQVGALYAMYFARRYGERGAGDDDRTDAHQADGLANSVNSSGRGSGLVAGAVYVEPLCDSKRIGDDAEAREFELGAGVLAALSSVGWMRITSLFSATLASGGEAAVAAEGARQAMCNPHTWHTMLGEYQEAHLRSFRRLDEEDKSAPPVGSETPAAVVYHSPGAHRAAMQESGKSALDAEGRELDWAAETQRFYGVDAAGDTWFESEKSLNRLHLSDHELIADAVEAVVRRASTA